MGGRGKGRALDRWLVDESLDSRIVGVICGVVGVEGVK